jgi:hypothetical protein
MSIANTLVREQTIKAIRGEPLTYELTFPEVFDRTQGRCRCELFISKDFIEAREIPFTLWPQISPYPEDSIKEKEIWVYDTSGKLLEHFNKLEIKVIDATFQAARDFGEPDIVFIGQHTDPNSMRLIAERLDEIEPKPVIIYLKQKQFLKETKLEVPTENNFPQNVKCDVNSPLLNGLNLHDIMSMVDKATFIKIKEETETGKSLESYVSEIGKDERYIYSFLCKIREKEQVVVYCQLPFTGRNNPIYAILIKNLLKFADGISDVIKDID